MTLYKLICEGPPGTSGMGGAYVLHILAESPEAAAKQAWATGHAVRTVFPRYRTSAVDRLRQKLGGVTPAAACPRCGYCLDGQVIANGRIRCPECGTSLRLYARSKRVVIGSEPG
jgi:DNA-directed RNA polymerase subunit RPC12/RpoP